MKLIADNLWTYVHGHLPVGLLDPPTSYFKKGAWFSRAYKEGFWDGKVRFVEFDKKTQMHRFPSGLLQDVLDHLDRLEYRYEFSDSRTVPEASPNYELLPDIRIDHGKYSYQGEALDAVLLCGRGVVKIPTGGGKTAIGAAVIRSVGGSWCWLTHKTGLLYQSQQVLSKRLGRPIGIVGNQEEVLEDVTVCMVQTLTEVFKRSGREHVRDWFRSCTGFIADEVHHASADSWRSLLMRSSAEFRVGLTATPPQPDAGGLELACLTGPILINLQTSELIRRGVLVPPRIWFVPCPEPEHKKGKIDWRELYKISVVENERRNQMIAEVAKTFKLEKKPSLILVRQINHGKLVLKELERKNVRAGWISGKVSQESRDRQFQQLWDKELDTIVAQAETVGEGVDLPPLKALVNATGTRGGGSAKDAEVGRSTVQFLGRGLRTYPGKDYFDYVDFSDSGHRSLVKATLDRLSTLELEGYGDYIRYWSEYRGVYF